MFVSEGIPSALATMPPGPVLAATLASLDRSRLNGYELVVVMQARSRQLAHDQAQLYADMAEIAYCTPGGADAPVSRDTDMAEFASDEIRAALMLTRRAAEMELDLAWRLTERLPRTWDALAAGTIDGRRARTIIHGTDHLDLETAHRVADAVLEKAPEMTTGQLAAWIRRLCIEIDPDAAAEKYREGIAERRVVAEANDDGTANLLGLHLPPHRVVAIRRHIEGLARSLRTAGECRTLDQLRADVFLDLLDGRLQSEQGSRGAINIHIDLETLAGLNDDSALIPGWGPVIADIARQAITNQPNAPWHITLTDPDTGAILWNGATRRRPTTHQTRFVQTRHPTCVFPGCRMPAADCDLDHIRPWARGGPTLVPNLAPDCRHDHILKTKGGWQLHQTAPNTYTWTSPLGHMYTTTGHPP